MSNEEQQKTNYPAAQPGSKQEALQRELKKMKNINLFPPNLQTYCHFKRDLNIKTYGTLCMIRVKKKKLAFSLCAASFWDPSVTHWNMPELKQIRDCVVIVVILVQSTNRNEQNAPFTVAAYLKKSLLTELQRTPASSNGHGIIKCLFDNHIFAASSYVHKTWNRRTHTQLMHSSRLSERILQTSFCRN